MNTRIFRRILPSGDQKVEKGVTGNFTSLKMAEEDLPGSVFSMKKKYVEGLNNKRKKVVKCNRETESDCG